MKLIALVMMLGIIAATAVGTVLLVQSTRLTSSSPAAPGARIDTAPPRTAQGEAVAGSKPAGSGQKVTITAEELSAQVRDSVEQGDPPVRNAAVRFTAPDQVSITGDASVAGVSLPVEIGTRLAIDDSGKVRVRTTDVRAVGAPLPASLTDRLRDRVDVEATAAIQAVLPPTITAQRIEVHQDRIVVEIGPRL